MTCRSFCGTLPIRDRWRENICTAEMWLGYGTECETCHLVIFGSLLLEMWLCYCIFLAGSHMFCLDSLLVLCHSIDLAIRIHFQVRLTAGGVVVVLQHLSLLYKLQVFFPISDLTHFWWSCCCITALIWQYGWESY